MARKNFIESYPIFNAVDASVAQESSITNVLKLDQAGIHVFWTDALSEGELVIEARNGDSQPWFELNFGSPIVIEPAANGQLQIILEQMPFTEIRLSYTPTAGAGVLSAILTSKTIGA